MRRREYLTLAALGLAGCSGQAQNKSTDEPHSAETTTSSLDLPDERTLPLREWHETDNVRVKTTSIATLDTAQYDSESGGIKTWDPGPDRMLVVTSYAAQNLSDERREWPTWETWQIVTPAGVVEPRVETPDGTSVEQIQPEDAIISWPQSSGLRADYRRGWSGVYTAPRTSIDRLAAKWTRPDQPVYWVDS